MCVYVNVCMCVCKCVCDVCVYVCVYVCVMYMCACGGHRSTSGVGVITWVLSILCFKISLPDWNLGRHGWVAVSTFLALIASMRSW